ncbi:hypothetical protein K7X08_011709 [Anisodus acutangulus]|uniref:Uncharacterized protein n=1 Tax=Anisodus acutangulus TaxID=402998 RepID=A0A9Q1MNK5_9SOLA|nr:hypothetical protein K7X08_011709 [Anisodus acutangulus]
MGKECFNLTFEYLAKPDILKMYRVPCQQKQPPHYDLYGYRWDFIAWAYETMSFVGKTAAQSKQCPLSILRWRAEEKFEPVDPFRNVTGCALLFLFTLGGETFLYLDDAEKSKKYIKKFGDYDEEVPNPNIDALKRGIGDTRLFRVKMNLASGSGHEDQVEDQDLGGRDKETCGHCGRWPSEIANRLTSIEDELDAIHKFLETKPRRHSKCVSFSVKSNTKRI